MRIVLLTLVGLGVACQPSTTFGGPGLSLSDTQRRETTDSVEALLQRVKEAFAHPDSSGDPLEDFITTGDIAAASDGQLMLSRDSLRKLYKEPAPPNSTMEFTAKKIDVLAPGVAAVTVRVVGRQDQGETIAERAGVWSGVMVVRDGRTRVVQQHQSMQPGVLTPKPRVGAAQ